MLKLVRLDQTSRAIVFEDEPITAHHIAACRVFRKIKSIFDQFENDIVTRQRENNHHHAGRSFGDDESIGRGFQMRDEIAVELCLAVSRMTDGIVEIDQTFARHEQAQVSHQFVGPARIDAEIGPRVRKQDRQIAGAEKNGIERDALVRVMSKAESERQRRI